MAIESSLLVKGDPAGGHQLDRDAENAFHSSLVSFQHPQRHVVRQHFGKIETHAGAGRARSRRPGRRGCARFLLRDERHAVQSTHQ